MKRFFLMLLIFAGAVLAAADFEIRVTSSSKTGWVKAGETVQVKAAVFFDGKPIQSGYKLQIQQWKDGASWISKYVPAEKEYSTQLSLDKPGWAFIAFRLCDAEKKQVRTKRGGRVSAGTGIILEPGKLKVLRPEPKDFDAFWEANKAELAKVPLKVLEKKKVSISKGADKSLACYDMKISCAGPRPVSGYLTVPLNKSRKYPAYLSVDGAGVRTSSKSAQGDRISFCINAHGILNGQPRKYYNDLGRNELKGYYLAGGADRNKIYFKYMFLRVLRALEYLKTLPEWNGKDIIVRGGSQGGAQTLFAAAMDKDVTLAVASVPAMCDFRGFQARRCSGWPLLSSKNRTPARLAAWDYYDCVYFARRITCPVYISTGLIDSTCVPTSVFVMYNQIKSENKHMETHRDMGHVGRNDAGNAAILKVCRQAAKK